MRRSGRARRFLCADRLRREPSRGQCFNGRIQALLALCSIILPGLGAGELGTGRDPQTGLSSWIWSEHGVSLRLIQLLPDQTRAFFLGRGFDADIADRIGRSCVFQTIFRNDGTRVVEYDQNKWSIIYLSERLPLKTREVWDREWEPLGVDDPARIAFRWSLLPTVQRFEPGDYNWGMTSFGLPPGACFDLSLTSWWTRKAAWRAVPSGVGSGTTKPCSLWCGR
jgi:hypothetical protein